MTEDPDAPGLRRLGGLLVAVLTVTALLVAAAPTATAREPQADMVDVGDGSSDDDSGGSSTTFYACAWAIASRPGGGGGGGAPRHYVCVQVYPHGEIVRCRYYAGAAVYADAQAGPTCEHRPSKSRENSQGVGVSAGTIPGTGVMVWPHCHMPYVHGVECGLNDQVMVGPGS